MAFLGGGTVTVGFLPVVDGVSCEFAVVLGLLSVSVWLTPLQLRGDRGGVTSEQVSRMFYDVCAFN